MAIRREILLIALLLLAIALLVKLVEFFQTNVVEGDASNFVLEDLQSKYPDADIAIMTITTKYNEKGARYFEVKAKVTQEPGSPCPRRSHIYYNYPVQNFVPQQPEVITNRCAVCTEGICTIAFQEEAIIASHTFPGTEDVHSYITRNRNAASYVAETTDSWTVTWDSEGTNSYYIIQVHRNGTVLMVKQLVKV
jgi:hypothetical protein